MSGSRADALVVLGAAVQEDGSPSPVLERRIRHAIELYHAGRARHLLLCGGTRSAAPTEASVMRAIALAHGVPAEHILVEPRSTCTLENAVHGIRILRTRGFRRAIVVTDRYHLLRSVLTFRALGMRASGSAVPGPRPPLRAWLREAVALPWYAWLLLRLRLAAALDVGPGGRRARWTGVARLLGRGAIGP